MAKFDVDVGGVTYEVDAPDEKTAWKWANVEHQRAKPAAPPKPIGPPQELSWAEKNLAPLLEKMGVDKMTTARPLAQAGLSMTTGPAQLVMNALPGLASAIPGGGTTVDAASELAGRLNKDIRAKEEAYQQTRGRDAGSFDPARTVGEVLNPINFAIGPAGKAATTLGRIGQGANIGAATALLQPTENENYGLGKGLQAAGGYVAGGLVPGAWEAAKGVGRLVRNVTQPLYDATRSGARAAVGLAGDKTDEVIKALMGAKPGQTAGQASVPANSAEFAALEKIVSEKNPSAFYGDKGVYGQQLQAKKDAIKSFAYTPEALAQAKGDRDMAALQLYGEAFAEKMKADPELVKLSKNPFFQDALPAAMKVVEARGLKPKTDMGEILQTIKTVLDKKLENIPGGEPIDNATKKSIATLKNDLVGWIGKNNPKYEAARAQYAKDSIPVNQMEGGQVLLDKLTDQKTTPKVFARTAAELDNPLLPQYQKVVDSVLEQMRNEKKFADLATAGSPKAREFVGDMSHVPAPGILNRAATIATAISRRLSSGGTNKSLMAISEIMKDDPKAFAELMRKAKPFERQEIVDAIMQASGRGAGVAAGETQ